MSWEQEIVFFVLRVGFEIVLLLISHLPLH